jgi:hypothetical protein
VTARGFIDTEVGVSLGLMVTSQHDALDALWVGIVRKRVNWILDLDIRSFLDRVPYCPRVIEIAAAAD